jgi:preprotein translocase subunit SecF
MKLLKLVPDDTNVKFLRWRIPFYVVSLILIAASWGLVLTKGLNYGVDFAGGLNITATFTESSEAPVGELRDSIADLGYGEPVVQRFGESNQVSIRVPLPESAEGKPEAAQAIANAIVAELEAGFPDFRLDGNENVSGKVSDEFRSDAAFALIAAMLAVALYIWVRFEWQFGVGGLFALFHDVSLTLGMFALFQLEFSLNIVAAILAIIGYSLNDTIVIYDRIRENLKKYRKMPLPELLDLSVNETLARTVMTSLSLLIALLPLLLFGPASLFGLFRAAGIGSRPAGKDRSGRGLTGHRLNEVFVAPRQLGRVRRPAEPLDRRRHPLARGRVGEQLAQRGGDAFDPARNDRACIAARHEFARTARVGDHDRGAAGERLDPGVGEALLLRRQRHRIGG